MVNRLILFYPPIGLGALSKQNLLVVEEGEGRNHPSSPGTNQAPVWQQHLRKTRSLRTDMGGGVLCVFEYCVHWATFFPLWGESGDYSGLARTLPQHCES